MSYCCIVHQVRAQAGRSQPAAAKAPARSTVPASRQGANVKKPVGGKVAKSGGKTVQSKAGEAVKKPALTKEDKMARRIQTAYRGYR